MSEPVSTLEHIPNGYGEHGPPLLELVPYSAEMPEQNPQLSPEDAAYALAQGPYLGRIAAIQTLMRHARAYDPETEESGLSLAGWVIPGLRAELARRRQELLEFEATWQTKSVPELDEFSSGVEPVQLSSPEPPVPAAKIQFGAPKRKTTAQKQTEVYYDPVSGLPAPAPGTILHQPAPLPARKLKQTKKVQDKAAGLVAKNKNKADPRDNGLCAQTDPEAFFPEKGGSTREAKRICLVCDVRDECLQYALDNDERFGIWGGYSERERRKLKTGSV